MNEQIDFEKIIKDKASYIGISRGVKYVEVDDVSSMMKEAVKQAIPKILEIVADKVGKELLYADDRGFDGGFITSLEAELIEMLKLK